MNKEILKYVKDEGWELTHDVDALAFAAEKTANLFSDVTPMKVIKFMLGDVPIGHFTHSYGFLQGWFGRTAQDLIKKGIINE